MNYKVKCPDCECGLSLQEIVDDNKSDILDMLDSEIEDEATEMFKEWRKEEKIEQLEFIKDSIKDLIDKEKYFTNGDKIDYKEALVKIMKDSEEYEK